MKMFFHRARKRKARMFIFGKLRFRDGLVWMVGLTVEMKLIFLNFAGVVWTPPYIEISYCYSVVIIKS